MRILLFCVNPVLIFCSRKALLFGRAAIFSGRNQIYRLYFGAASDGVNFNHNWAGRAHKLKFADEPLYEFASLTRIICRRCKHFRKHTPAARRTLGPSPEANRRAPINYCCQLFNFISLHIFENSFRNCNILHIKILYFNHANII